jgi:class 3 adenylate cyclase
LRKYKSLQKIETIGDSYMIVGDLTKYYNKDIYVNEMVIMAFDLIQIANKIMLPNKEFLNIRVGIHIGDVVIGILGVDIPRLCVIGNNVNFTSRLESTSEKNKVHISNEIYQIVKENEAYHFNKRENINLKNIGTFDTYFVSLC